MADKDITLGIGTTADTSGAEAVEESIKKVQKAGKDAAEDGKRIARENRDNEAAEKRAAIERAVTFSELSRNIGQFGGALADKIKEAASEVEAFDKEAASALRNTAENVQEAVGAATALASGFASGGPLGLGVAALGVGLRAVVNDFQAVEVAAIKAAAAERKALESAEEAIRDATTAQRQRINEIERSGVESAILRENEALEKGLDLLEKQISAERRKRQEKERILVAEDKLKLAEIDRAEALGEEGGGISSEEATIQRDEVEAAARERKRAEERQAASEESAKAEEEARLKEEEAGRDFKRAQDSGILADKRSAEVAEAERQQREREDAAAALEKDVAGGVEDVRAFGPNDPTVFKRKNEAKVEFENKKKQLEEEKRQIEISAKEIADLTKQRDLAIGAANKDATASSTSASAASEARQGAISKADIAASTASTVAEEGSLEEAAIRTRREAQRILQRREEEEARRRQEAADIARENQRQQGIDRSGGEVADRVGGALQGANPNAEATRRVTEATNALRDGTTGAEVDGLLKELLAFANVSVSASADQKAKLNQAIREISNLKEQIRRK